ncbi:hypothetical protein ACQ4LE_010774 [Meloidogyne hapla]|uniref:SAND domain-containing protein n=1 Tax=Meloidogyne hapla TaxID=6305 RepID=A0A1I8BWE3_MELHA
MDCLDSINSEKQQTNVSNLFQFSSNKISNEELKSEEFMEFDEQRNQQKIERINEFNGNLNFEDDQINLRNGNELIDDEELNGIEENNNLNNNYENQNQQQQQTPTRPSSSSNYFQKEECSGDELPPNEELIGAPLHEIRCGLLIGKLHMIRFTCPGIHRKCVEFEGKLISPRQFTIKAEKDKQKDWKGSIRLGKHNLRTLMEMKTLDFYEHENNCSLKCQSRNYIKNRKAEGNFGGNNNNNEMATNSDNNSERFSEMCEINDIKSIPSSACSSATSTRKSSTVLEEFACQTVPPMSGCIYSDHSVHQQKDYLNEIEEDDEMSSKTLINYSSPSSSSTTNSFLPSTSSTLPLNSSNIISSEYSNNDLKIKKGMGESSSLLNNSNLNTLLQLQQNNSPLKQLLLLPKNLTQNNNGIALNSNGGHHLENIKTPNIPKPSSSTTLIPSITHLPPPPSENTNNLSHEAALALLLQSVQTSIILEQQQKAANLNNNQNNNLLLTQLVNTLNGGGGGTLQQQHQQHSSLLSTTNKNLINGNGIEKLLAAAALSQQLQQQRTPLKHNEQPAAVTNISNIRKSMEENATMFWSQMRNMGLLEDMLKTLSDTLERLKQIYLTGGNAVSEEFAAQRLSGVAIALDLCSLFGEKIHSRYIQATLESTLISKELLELQRKQDEQKRKLENAKRKSQVFDQILKNGDGTTTTLINKNINSLRGTNHSSSSTNENGTPEIKKIHLNI